MQQKISLSDEERIQAFINQASRLSSCKFFRNGKPKLLLGFGSSVTKAIVPEQQEFKEMLMVLRPFLMDKEEIFFHKIEPIVKKQILNDTTSLKELGLIYNKFIFYTGAYDNEIPKYQKKYKMYVSPYPDITCDFGKKTIHNMLDLVINGYYFHFDPKKQEELVNFFVTEQQQRWLGSLKQEEIEGEILRMTRETVREAFKFRLYKLVIEIASCIFELKKIVEDNFNLPLHEEAQQKSQILHDFL
jgi:hypothetical protein